MRHRERQIDTERDRETQRDTERDRERDRERQRETERNRERQRLNVKLMNKIKIPYSCKVQLCSSRPNIKNVLQAF